MVIYDVCLWVPRFYNDIASGLMVWMEIDSTDDGWAVTLNPNSALSIDGGTLPNPNLTLYQNQQHSCSLG